MQIEVRFPTSRRMWPARLQQVGLDDDGRPLFEAVPVEDGCLGLCPLRFIASRHLARPPAARIMIRCRGLSFGKPFAS